MAGVTDRVQGFLESWPIIKDEMAIREQVNSLLEEQDGRDGMVEFEGGLQTSEDIHADTLQAPEGEVSPSSAPSERDMEIQRE